MKASLLFFLTLMPASMAGAQEWSELNTLTFTPVSPDRSAPVAMSFGVGGTSGARAGGALEREPTFSEILAAIEEIDAEREESGQNSPSLIPLLRELAGLYRETGDYPDALVTLAQAQDIVRRREGLNSLDQAALIEEMIEIEMAIVPSEVSDGQEAYLRQLVRRNPGDPRNVEILTEMAGRQMDVARYVLVNGIPPEFVLNVDAMARGGFRQFIPSRTSGAVATSILRRARASYGQALQEALAAGDGNVSRLLELESSIIDTYYFELMNPDLRRRGQPVWAAGSLRFGGMRALEAKLDNSTRFPGTPEAVTAAMLELADWHLMFTSFGRAMDAYQEALTNLEDKGVSGERIAAMLSPETPVPLPAFTANASVYSGSSDQEGYFDVELEINRFGRVRDFDVVARSGNATDAVLRRLKRFVYQSRFRPRYIDGEWLRSDRFTQRYEFGYQRNRT